MSEWPEIALTDIYEISSGLSKSADSFGSGYPFLSFKDVFGNYFIPDELSQLVESSERERLKGSIKRGDVFLTRTSETMHELGMSSVALKGYPDATFNGFTKRLRPKEGTPYEVHPEFIGYYLRSPMFRRGMLAFSTMSTRASLNNDMIGRLTVKLPPLEVQKNIARILKALDDKNELNRQTNQTLEQIAQAIFKSWFVDFEPVKAKIAAKQKGQDPELATMCAISGKTEEQLKGLDEAALQQLKSTAALFPDALVESELGEIPEGWEIVALKDLSVKISKGTTPRKSEIVNTKDEESIPFLKVRDLSDDGEITRLGLDTVPYSVHLGALKRSILETNDLLFSIAGTIGRVALIEKDLNNSNCNQAVAFVRLKEPEKYLELCRLNLASNRVQGEVISKVVQGVQANFSLTGLGEIQILLANQNLLDIFNENIVTIAVKQRLLLKANRKLSELRDVLLPKLISGEIELNSEVAA